MSTILFDDIVSLFHGYVNLADAPPLNRTVYAPSGTTALYDAVAAGTTNMVMYAQTLRQSGVMVRCLIIVYSEYGAKKFNFWQKLNFFFLSRSAWLAISDASS